jgi:hypothetical protein
MVHLQHRQRGLDVVRLGAHIDVVPAPGARVACNAAHTPDDLAGLALKEEQPLFVVPFRSMLLVQRPLLVAQKPRNTVQFKAPKDVLKTVGLWFDEARQKWQRTVILGTEAYCLGPL